jgi:hypothetical protein
MTPQERQLIAELFDRLASLENTPRDPDAVRAIEEGFSRAPHAAYPLVQTVLVQDEALKRANARIEDLEAALGGSAPGEGAPRGFLDNMRDALFGREEPRGSVPTVRPGGLGSSGVWGTQPGPQAAPAMGGQPMMPPGSGGGSFLGTAAASAAGVIGGAMLLNGIRSMFDHPQARAGAFDPGGGSPWGGGAAGSGLAREAGLDDIGGSRSAGMGGDERRAGLLGNDEDEDDRGGFDDDDFDTAGDVDGGDSDDA